MPVYLFATRQSEWVTSIYMSAHTPILNITVSGPGTCPPSFLQFANLPILYIFFMIDLMGVSLKTVLSFVQF